MELSYRGRTYRLRSSGLFRFVDLLQRHAPAWVDLAAIAAVLPGIAPRQLARFIDNLEALQLPLVSYETKTRGRYRLAVPAAEVGLHARGAVQQNPSRPAPPRPQAAPVALPQLLDENWIAWTVELVYSQLRLSDGHLDDEGGALTSLACAELACRSLPPWARSVVDLRRALVLGKTGQFREAQHCLRRVRTAIRSGLAHPGAARRLPLILAKLDYDRGRYGPAETRLSELPPPVGVDAGFLNMRALLNGRKLLAASPVEAPAILADVLADLTLALGDIFLGNCDIGTLDYLSFNTGNNILRAVRQGILPPGAADSALQWFACNRLVCRKFGIGDDSILVDLLLVDVGLEFGYSVARWPRGLTDGLSDMTDLGKLLADALGHARRSGNPLEIAECLLRQVRYLPDKTAAEAAYHEAWEICDALGRGDLRIALTAARNARSTTAM